MPGGGRDPQRAALAARSRVVAPKALTPFMGGATGTRSPFAHCTSVIARASRHAEHTMLRWILALFTLCVASAALGFGKIVPLPGASASICLAVFALSATLLIGSFEAYETQAVRAERDDR